MRSTDSFHDYTFAGDLADSPRAACSAQQHPSTFAEAIDRLRLPITVVAGRASLSVAQIDALQTGAIVELTAMSECQVELLVNQHTIAIGRLVLIDQRVAVQILSLKRDNLERL